MAHAVSNSSHQNYYFKNGTCYTEDHIQVQKLHLFNIPYIMPDDVLLKHFKHFGHVIEMKIYGNPKPQSLPNQPAPIGSRKYLQQEKKRNGKWRVKSGWVYYANPRDAARALHSRIHRLHGLRLYVQASDSWHQPDVYGSSELQTTQSEDAKILKISDPCLLRILLHLSLADQIRFSRVCMRFRDVYQLIARSAHRSIDVSILDGLTVWDLRDFFHLSGPYVQKVEGVLPPIRSERLCNFFGMHCVNVKSLELKDSKLNPKSMMKLFAKVEKLENLELSNCSLSDGSLKALMNCKSLKKLNLAHNPKLSGTNLIKLPGSIESLDLTACIKADSTRLIQMCKVLPNLKDLNIIGINIYSETFYETLAKKRVCPKLETINLSITDNYSHHEEIAKLPKLKNINIVAMSGKQVRLKLFQQLAALKTEQLERLEIYGAGNLTRTVILELSKITGLQRLALDRANYIADNALEELINLKKLEYISLRWCNTVSDTAMLHIILGCPKLWEIHVEDCTELTDKLVLALIKKVQHQILFKENERKLPIHLYVQGCKINESIETHPDVAAAKNIIKFFYKSDFGSDILHIYARSISMMHDYGYHPHELTLGTDDEMDFFDDHYLFDMGFLDESDVDSDLDSVELELLANNVPPYVHPSYPYDDNGDFVGFGLWDSDSD